MPPAGRPVAADMVDRSTDLRCPSPVLPGSTVSDVTIDRIAKYGRTLKSDERQRLDPSRDLTDAQYGLVSQNRPTDRCMPVHVGLMAS